MTSHVELERKVEREVVLVLNLVPEVISKQEHVQNNVQVILECQTRLKMAIVIHYYKNSLCLQSVTNSQKTELLSAKVTCLDQ